MSETIFPTGLIHLTPAPTDEILADDGTQAGYLTVADIRGPTLTLSTLPDVVTTGIVTGNILSWNGSAWVAGVGSFISLAGAQTITGNKAFSGVTTVPTVATADNSTNAASTAWSNLQGFLKSNQTVTLTGDANGSGTTGIAVTLTNSGVVAGSYGSSLAVPTYTVDAKGRLTSATSVAIAFPVVSVFGRSGIITMALTDVTTALGYTPLNPSAGTNITVGTIGSNGLLVYSSLAISQQGANLHWNRSGSDGATWLINQKGSGAGGTHFGEATSANVYTEGMVLDASGNLTVTTKVLAPSISTTGTIPTFAWQANGHATDQNIADILMDGSGSLFFRLLNDAYTAAYNYISVFRSGYTATGISLNAVTTITSSLKVTGGEIVGSAGITGSTYGQCRLIGANTGIILRNDDTNFYVLKTASGSPSGTFDSTRPLAISMTTGAVTVGNGLTVTGGLTTDTFSLTGSLTTTNIGIQTAYPTIYWKSTGNPTDQNISDVLIGGSGTIYFRLLNDAYNAANNWMTVTRSGYVPNSVSIYAPLTVSSNTTGDFGTINNASQMLIQTLTSSSKAVLAFNVSGAFATKIGVDAAQGFVIGGWSLPANALAINSSGLTVSGSIYTRPTGSTTSIDIAQGDPRYVIATAFGADPSGVSDSAAAINAAIAEAATLGKDVLLPIGVYLVGSTINLGNGAAGAISTYNGVRLIGMGYPTPGAQFGGYDTTSSTRTNSVRLRWIGNTTSAMISINGPMEGWGLENLHLQGTNADGSFGSTAYYGILITSGQYGSCRNIVIESCLYSIYSTTRQPFNDASSNPVFLDCYRNLFQSTFISVPYTNGAIGIVLTGVIVTGTSYASANTDYNQFFNTAIVMPTAHSGGFTGSAYGVYFAAADSCVMHGLQFFNHGSCSFPITYDYTINSSWPAACDIYNVDWGPAGITPAPVQSAGTPDGTARPNHIFGLSEANASVLPANATPNVNLNTVTENVGAVAIVGQSVSYATTTLHSVYASGLFRVSYYIGRTGGNAVGGYAYLNILWSDNQGAQNAQSGNMSADSSGAQRASGSVDVFCTAGSTIQFNSVVTGITSGSTLYSVHMAVERLSYS